MNMRLDLILFEISERNGFERNLIYDVASVQFEKSHYLKNRP